MKRRRSAPAGAPCHVVVVVGWDIVALCGERDPLPLVGARWAWAHVLGHGLALCPACAGAGLVP